MKIITFFVLLMYFNPVSSNTVTERDFDHQVQFSQTQIDETSYLLKVLRLNGVSFETMSVFAFRKSFELCGHYGFNMEVIGGVELFNDKAAMPNKIFPALEVKVHCAT